MVEDWNKLENAFARALALDGDKRDEFVARFEAAAPELGRELRNLLAADMHDSGDDPFERAIAACAAALAANWKA